MWVDVHHGAKGILHDITSSSGMEKVGIYMDFWGLPYWTSLGPRAKRSNIWGPSPEFLWKSALIFHGNQLLPSYPQLSPSYCLPAVDDIRWPGPIIRFGELGKIIHCHVGQKIITWIWWFFGICWPQLKFITWMLNHCWLMTRGENYIHSAP